MEDQQQDVLVGRQPHQDGPDHQVPAQVEGTRRLLLQQPTGGPLTLRLRLRAEVQHAQLHRRRRPDDLHRHAVHTGERGAQGLVALNDGAEGAPERVDVQRPFQAEAGVHVVGAGAGLQLLDEPEPLLREGGRARVRVPAARYALPAVLPASLAQQHLLQRRTLSGGQPGRPLSQVVLRHEVSSRPPTAASSAARRRQSFSSRASTETFGSRSMSVWFPGTTRTSAPSAARARHRMRGSR